MNCRFQYVATLILVAVAVWTATGKIAGAADPPGVVIDFWDAATQQYIGNPSIAVLPNGDYVASHDAWGPAHPFSQVYLFHSQDSGASWSAMGDAFGQYESTLFVHNNGLYLMGGGTSGGNEFVSIRKSTDGGANWTAPLDASTGRVFDNSNNINAGATQVIVHDGRIWRAMEQVEPSIPPGSSTNYRSFVLSAPVGADLLNASSWTASNSLLLNDYLPGRGWYEGGVVVTPQGNPATMLRTAFMGDYAALLDVSADGTTTSYNPANAFIDFQGGANGKFTVRFDETTGRYWSLVNDHPNPGDVRNVLSLASSANLTDWEIESAILSDPDPVNVGFQYADFHFDGDDIIFVSRTAYNGAANFHDANYMTFHRIPDFRLFARDSVVTVPSLNDGELDQHINWHLDAKGIPGTWTDAEEMLVGRLADDYQTPVVGPAKFGVMKFDVSALTGRTIIGATLRLIQTAEDGTVDGEQQRPPAALPATTDVYGVISGDYDEATSSWNNYVSNSDGTSLNDALAAYLASGAIAPLGSMTNANNPGGLATGSGGVTTFSDVDLTALIQSWVDNPATNLGLLLLNQAVFETTAPAGPNDILARYATHESTAFDGPQLIIHHVPAIIPGDFNLDGNVDGLDLDRWKVDFGNGSGADADGDGDSDGADFLIWQRNLTGAPASWSTNVPEPTTASLALMLMVGVCLVGQREKFSR